MFLLISRLSVWSVLLLFVRFGVCLNIPSAITFQLGVREIRGPATSFVDEKTLSAELINSEPCRFGNAFWLLNFTLREPSANGRQKTLNKCETQNEIVFHIRLRHPETINSVSLISVSRIRFLVIDGSRDSVVICRCHFSIKEW